jgi:hypothetical protein
MNKENSFLKGILTIAVFLIIVVLVLLLLVSQYTLNNYMIPEIKQNCINFRIYTENINISPSTKEAAINAIDDFPLCQNLTKNNIT